MGVTHARYRVVITLYGSNCKLLSNAYLFCSSSLVSFSGVADAGFILGFVAGGGLLAFSALFLGDVALHVLASSFGSGHAGAGNNEGENGSGEKVLQHEDDSFGYDLL